MSFYEKGAVRIRYEEAGSGLPLLVIAGGGLNSTIAGLNASHTPFNPMEVLNDEYRCIAADLRNANGGQSTGPLEIDRPWDAYTDDHLGVMDHLGIDKFMVLGFCIGGPFIWNLLKRAPNRVVAAVLAQPSGSRPEMRDLFYDNNMKGWGPALTASRPEITMATVEKFLTKMYRTDPDFVFTVTRDFVRNCQTPVLILPDDVPPHPYAVAMEAAMLAPKAEVSMYPWKEPKERIPLAVRQIRFVPARAPAGRRLDGEGPSNSTIARLSWMQSRRHRMDDKTQTELEAAVYRRLVEHLRQRTDVQNIDMMNLAGFCRNCLSNWMKDAADAKGLPMTKDQSREIVYGEPFDQWKAKHQKEASKDQKAAFEKSSAAHKH